MKVFICDLSTDLNQIKPGTGDKVVFLTGTTIGNEPMVPLSLLSFIQGIKSKIEYLYMERGDKLNYAVAMLYAIEKSKNNEVIIKSSLTSIAPQIYEQVYLEAFKGEVKKAPRKKKDTEKDIEPVKEEKPAEETKVVEEEKPANKPEQKKEAQPDDLDVFMDNLSKIHVGLVPHTGHLIEAARLSKNEKISYSEAIKKVIGKNGDTAIKALGENASKIYEEAIKIED